MSNELPKNFEEYQEARKEGFLAVKEFKDQGGTLAGCLCSYTPTEILDAAGIASEEYVDRARNPFQTLKKYCRKISVHL